jgi:hypothetical protein
LIENKPVIEWLRGANLIFDILVSY